MMSNFFDDKANN